VALHFTRRNALLLLVPKTGSTWIRMMVKGLGLDAEEVGDPAMRDHDFLAAFDRAAYSLVGAFVRNPVDWYPSYWSYRMECGWRPLYPLDRHCRCDDFETFVRQAVTTLPGALGKIYTSYVGEPGAEVDSSAARESLAHDFSRFLRLARRGRRRARATRRAAGERVAGPAGAHGGAEGAHHRLRVGHDGALRIPRGATRDDAVGVVRLFADVSSSAVSDAGSRDLAPTASIGR
jgi:hypothetical protein